MNDYTAGCEPYKGADPVRSVTQLAVTAILFLLACSGLLYAVLQGWWVLYALLILPAGGLLVRLFIIQHDCGHGSFFKTRAANDWVGRCVSLFTFTPYDFWRRTHNLHHAGSGNLERRGYGGIETLTVSEYNALSPRGQFKYRFYRNPLFLLVFGTPLFMLIGQRFPLTDPFFSLECCKALKLKGIWRSVMGLNLGIALFYGVMMFAFGVGAVIVAYGPVLLIASWVGGWLFFMQHQFEDMTWDHEGTWTFDHAAVHGSSFYDLHPVLHWFTGDIGLHHIHHLCAAIPNYKLQECLKANPVFREINRITLRESLKCASLALWDESRRKMVGFKDVVAHPITLAKAA
jgi:omega-6 fatty acid desaturase (delta-12 desaturase)